MRVVLLICNMDQLHKFDGMAIISYYSTRRCAPCHWNWRSHVVQWHRHKYFDAIDIFATMRSRQGSESGSFVTRLEIARHDWYLLPFTYAPIIIQVLHGNSNIAAKLLQTYQTGIRLRRTRNMIRNRGTQWYTGAASWHPNDPPHGPRSGRSLGSPATCPCERRADRRRSRRPTTARLHPLRCASPCTPATTGQQGTHLPMLPIPFIVMINQGHHYCRTQPRRLSRRPNGERQTRWRKYFVRMANESFAAKRDFLNDCIPVPSNR